MATTNGWLRARAVVVAPSHQLCSFLGTRCVWPSSRYRSSCSSSSSSVSDARCSLQPPDVPLLAQSARISLTPKEAEDFAPKIRQVIDWFGQLQAIDLESVEPALRADTEVDDNSRLDSPVTFENREAMLAGVPCYEEPYIKVPKVLNKE